MNLLKQYNDHVLKDMNQKLQYFEQMEAESLMIRSAIDILVKALYTIQKDVADLTASFVENQKNYTADIAATKYYSENKEQLYFDLINNGL